MKINNNFIQIKTFKGSSKHNKNLWILSRWALFLYCDWALFRRRTLW